MSDSSQSGYILVHLHSPETLAMPVQHARSSMDQSLSAVLSQLDTFVQIVDAASQVCYPTLLSIYHQPISGNADQSIRTPGMAGCVIALHGEHKCATLSMVLTSGVDCQRPTRPGQQN